MGVRHHDVRIAGDDGAGGRGGVAGEDLIGSWSMGGSGQAPVTDLSSDIIMPQGMFLGLLAGVGLGLLAIVMTVMALVMKRWTKPKKKIPPPLDLSFDYTTDLEVSKSAPVTRSPSPSLEKRWLSYKEERPSPLVRSMTADMIPMQLPAQEVQPPSDEGPRVHSSTPQQYQKRLIGHLPRMDSDTSQESESGSPLPADDPPRIWFSVLYDGLSQLKIHLLRARHIKARDHTNGPRDPFVKLYLLPDKKTSHQTRVLKKTLTPNFNETFTFSVSPEEVPIRSLRMSMYDVDKRRVRHSLGHVVLPLSELNLNDGAVISKDMECGSQGNVGLGDIQLSLMFSPGKEKLSVKPLCAQDLRESNLHGSQEVYVRAQLYHGSKLHRTRRTSVGAPWTEAVFTETLSFTLPGRQLESCSLQVSLMTEANHEYGRVVLGSFLYARGQELRHWDEMIASPRTPTIMWHSLCDPRHNHTH